MKTYLFELCAESVQAAQAAELGGADRIELCSQLSIGGVTPSEELIAAVIRAVSIPVHVLIRPRGGDFVYSPAEFDQMRRQIDHVKQAGAAGIAIGVLLPDGNVDLERSRELVRHARPLSVTFHRAFDETANLTGALESVIQTGADCLLTSGRRPIGNHGRRRSPAHQPRGSCAAHRRFLPARVIDAQKRNSHSCGEWRIQWKPCRQRPSPRRHSSNSSSRRARVGPSAPPGSPCKGIRSANHVLIRISNWT